MITKNIKILLLIIILVCSINFLHNDTNSLTNKITNKNLNQRSINKKSDEFQSNDFIQKIDSINFKAIINPIDTEKYTLESDKIFKEAYLKVLNNISPIKQSNGDKDIFLKDLIRGKELTNDEFENFIKKFIKYKYIDFDNDGLPELIFEIDGPIVLKYSQEKNLVYIHYSNYNKWHIFGSGQVYYFDPTSVDRVTYIYQSLDNNANVIESVNFELHSEYDENTKEWFKSRFIIFNDSDKKLIDENTWDKTTKTFFESINADTSYKTFEELFY